MERKSPSQPKETTKKPLSRQSPPSSQVFDKMKVTGKAHIYGAMVSGSEKMSYGQAFEALREEMRAEAEGNEVLAAHLEMLEDPLLEESINSGIESGLAPVDAVAAAAESIAAMFAEIDDEYLRARVDDVRDVCSRLEMKLEGVRKSTDIPEGCILVAEELLPSDIAAIDLSRIRGISCHKGSSTSHVVIMSHARGIPVAMGADNSGIAEGDTVCVDDPFIGGTVAEKVRKAGRAVYVNAGSIEDIKNAIEAGADGIGVFRTEFLYLKSTEAPGLEIQENIYRQAMELCKGKTLIIRTLDIGGDKDVPWLGMAREDNPFLGVRGIRLALEHHELLKTQLDALCRAAEQVPECKVKIMLPMVCTAAEVASAKALLGDRAEQLVFGAMVETPAAALDIDSLCEECSFFSIGSNDLTQYVMAADRGNAAVAGYYDPMCAPMQRLIRKIVCDAHSHGVPVGICGEMASDPAATEFLLDAGLDSLSLNRL